MGAPRVAAVWTATAAAVRNPKLEREGVAAVVWAAVHWAMAVGWVAAVEELEAVSRAAHSAAGVKIPEGVWVAKEMAMARMATAAAGATGWGTRARAAGSAEEAYIRLSAREAEAVGGGLVAQKVEVEVPEAEVSRAVEVRVAASLAAAALAAA